MKATIVAAALAQGAAAVAAPNGPGNGNWGPGNGAGFGGFGYGGGFGGFGPGGFGMGVAQCASSCFSSHFATATPTPQAFCTDTPALNDCVRSACTTNTAALASYTSVSSSVCNAFTSCASTSTFTYSGGWWGGASKTDAAVTITGCPVDGWWGPGGAWGGMGPGWAYKTDTVTVTRTVNGVPVTGPATVAQAVSGSSTLLTTFTGALAAQETGSSGSGSKNAAAGGDSNRAVKVAGAALGAVVAVVGLM
ncbi:uncharacterized protein LY79DRAFT_600718 [Colletotrichum navitas]|uniref:Extracellular membrane protein CFEM domain-containing protein n=1 Tax=Colletotrichum navitas TaxID=681940 RepID=A0AAD8V8Z7_9PEZI|nr:uncharacterized protein LY79DRAFT_600718 [Colletotrichum navitas]KAK1596808.1 hypothetical protein LY79DRAFT_600718 [Colletotrichum navitas]